LIVLIINAHPLQLLADE